MEKPNIRSFDNSHTANRAPIVVLGTAVSIVVLYWWLHGLVVLISLLGIQPLRNAWLARAVVAFSILGAGIAAERISSITRGSKRDAIRIGEDGSGGINRYARGIGGVIAVFALVTLAWVTLVAVWLPMTAYDALGYRVPTIAQWLDAGRITWVASDDPVRNGYPMGLEAIGAVVSAAFGSMAFIDFLSVPLIVAGGACVWLVAGLTGARPFFGRTAAAVFVLVPMNVLNGPSGYVDAAFAGALVALFALISAASEPVYRFGTVAAIGAGMAATLVMGIKGTGVVFVAVVAIGVAARGYFTRSLNVSRVVWFILFSIPGVFWTVRNAVYTGNPLWPVDVYVAGYHLLPGVSTVDSIMEVANNTPPALRGRNELIQIALTWMQPWGPATGFDERLAGLGYAWPLLALPAIAWCVFRIIKERAFLSLPAFYLLITGVCFLLQPMRWWARYTVWLWGAGGLALALAGEAWATLGRQKSFALVLTLVAALCVGEGAFVLYHVGGIGPLLASRPVSALASVGFNEVRGATFTRAGIDPVFWTLGLDRHRHICRGWWKPGTDNTNLDGVFAQLSPRPRIVIIQDEGVDWPHVKRHWLATSCIELLLMSASPVIAQAQRDRSVSVVHARAFDPLFIIRRAK